MNEEELLEKWQIHKVVQEAISKAHNEPSPETKKRLENIEKTLEKIVNLLNKIVNK